jgi:hypothetical protein
VQPRQERLALANPRFVGPPPASPFRPMQEQARAFRIEAALELAGMERLVWGDDWIELQVYLQRQQSRMAAVGLAQPEMTWQRRSTWVHPRPGSARRRELKVHWRQLSAVPRPVWVYATGPEALRLRDARRPPQPIGR